MNITDLLKEGKNSGAVAFFFADMLPAEMIEKIKKSPDWAFMEAVAPTLEYENKVTGDGSITIEIAKKVTTPTLMLDSDKSRNSNMSSRCSDQGCAACPEKNA